MPVLAAQSEAAIAIRTDLGAIFVSLELSRSTWLITSLSPGGGEKVSKHTVRSGDVAGLRARFSRLSEKAPPQRTSRSNHRDTGGGSGRILDPPLATGR